MRKGRLEGLGGVLADSLKSLLENLQVLNVSSGLLALALPRGCCLSFSLCLGGGFEAAGVYRLPPT